MSARIEALKEKEYLTKLWFYVQIKQFIIYTPSQNVFEL